MKKLNMNKFNMNKFPTLLIFTVAIAFIGIGLYQGQQIDVLNKAIRICLECVGIG